MARVRKKRGPPRTTRTLARQAALGMEQEPEAQEQQELWVPGPLPSLNELLNTAKARKGRFLLNTLKEKWHSTVKMASALDGLRPICPSHFTYLLLEDSKRRDPSNVAASAVKLIEDGLQEAGFLRNDGWKYILDFRCYVRETCDSLSSPGVLMVANPSRILSLEEMVLIAKEL